MSMKFKEGTAVKTMGGDKVGNIDHIVLDPTTDKVTHIVVKKGFLFAEDRVVPVNVLRQADEDYVILDMTTDEFEALPQYEETHYIQPNRDYRPHDSTEADWETKRPLFFYAAPHTGVYPYHLGPVGGVNPDPQIRETVRNVPDRTISIDAGTKVRSIDGEHAGDIKQTFTDENGHITHILISKGFIFKTERLIPVHWLDQMSDDEIQLHVRTEVVEDLPEYSD